jgi:putative nucleotidyltransferase with HDIG domain
MNVDQLVKEILADLRSNRLKLPTLPQVAIKISDIINDPNATTKNVARVISADAALSARMIQVANSPMVRAISPVDNVQMAITRMGMSMLRNVVTSFLVQQLFHSKHQRLRQQVAELWNHSVRVAAISHVLAERYSRIKPDEAMLAGLIHDIGKLPIIAKADDLPALADNEKIMDELSHRLHAKLGKIIVDTWGFAPAVVTAVAEHENLQRNSESLDLADIITVANLLSYAGKEHRLTKTDWTTVPAFEKLGLSPEDSIATLNEARGEISEIIGLLQ